MSQESAELYKTSFIQLIGYASDLEDETIYQKSYYTTWDLRELQDPNKINAGDRVAVIEPESLWYNTTRLYLPGCTCGQSTRLCTTALARAA